MTTTREAPRLLSESFTAAVEEFVPAGASLCIAFSGGVDSSVLLHIAATSGLRPLRAVYVDHALHSDSAGWGEHCRQVCEVINVPFSSLTVDVDAAAGGLEAAARNARYRALADCMQPGEVLLTAHHEQDQLETFLLQTLRGGVRGLAAMPVFTETAGVPHLRPLLTVPDALVQGCARELGLEWIEDPGNAEHRFDRNFLRHEVLPKVAERWPSAATAVSRSARLIGESAELLDELARNDLADSLGSHCLRLESFRSLPRVRQKNALRYAIRMSGLSTPSERQLIEALDALLDSGADAQPVAAWPGSRIRRYRDVLWLYSEQDDPLEAVSHAAESVDWFNPDQPLQLGKVRGVLETCRRKGEGVQEKYLQQGLQVRYRAGGEKLRPTPGGRQRTLKNLLQELDVLPWMRSNIPMLYSGEELLAVADIWVNSDFAVGSGESGVVFCWHDHAPVFHDSALSGEGLSGNL